MALAAEGQDLFFSDVFRKTKDQVQNNRFSSIENFN
jgi:hypothetical protein